MSIEVNISLLRSLVDLFLPRFYKHLAPTERTAIEVVIMNELLRKSLIVAVLLVLSSSLAYGGIRGPGEYSGVVIFDHWDTCYLYDGVYLMYISNSVKERVRKYEGQAVRIDATEVYQPMNPGDGLIREFQSLRVIENRRNSDIAGIVLTITPAFDIDCSPQFVIEIKNAGKKKFMIPKGALAPTLFNEQTREELLSPSDGNSGACITRWGFPWARGEAQTLAITRQTPSGPVTMSKWWGLKIDDGKVPFDYLTLSPGDSAHFKASLSVSPGSYDFLCGYAPEDDKKISNMVSFTVDANGVATLACDWRIGPNRQ